MYSPEEFQTVYSTLEAYVVPKASAHGMTIYELSDLILRRVKLSERNQSVILSAERPRATHPSETI